MKTFENLFQIFIAGVAIGILFFSCEDDNGVQPPDKSKIIVHQNPPPNPDKISGLPGAVKSGAKVIIYVDKMGCHIRDKYNRMYHEMIAEVQADLDGSFPEVDIGNNLHHWIYISVRDPSNGKESSPIMVENDIYPPRVKIISAPPKLTRSGIAEFRFVCDEEPCKFYCNSEPCSSPYIHYYNEDGTHFFRVYGEDKYGNKDEESGAFYSWVIDISGIVHWLIDMDFFIPLRNPLSMGDVTGDGRVDIVLASWMGSYINNMFQIIGDLCVLDGKSGAVIWCKLEIGPKSAPLLGDIDGDGRLEIVVLGDKLFALNGEDGSLVWSFDTSTRLPPVMGDVDGDGKLEVITNGNSDGIWILNGEDGSVQVHVGGSMDYVLSLSGDINGDGITDIVASGGGTRMFALNGRNGDVIWRNSEMGGLILGSGDINGDGEWEVVCGRNDIGLYVLSAKDGKLLWKNEEVIDPSSAMPVDIERDGKIEIGVVNDDYELYMIDGEDGSIKWKIFVGAEYPPAIGDVDGDGKLDIVVNGDKLYIIDGENGAIKWEYSTGYGNGPSLSLGDINNDEILDMVVPDLFRRIYALSTSAPIPSPSLLPWPEFGGYGKNWQLDPWEYNDTLTSATHLIDLVRNGAIPGYIWRESDVDWYYVNVKEKARLEVRLEDIPDGRNYDLCLYDDSENLILSSTNPDNKNEKITYEIQTPGKYFIKVFSSSGHSHAIPYSLYVKLVK